MDLKYVLLPPFLFLIVGSVGATIGKTVLEFNEPLSTDNTNPSSYYGSFSSEQSLAFQANMEADPNDDGDLYLYVKQPGDRSFSPSSDLTGFHVEVFWDHFSELPLAGGNLESSQEVTLDAGQSTTVTFDGEEHTIELVDNSETNDGDETVRMRIDGIGGFYTEGESDRIADSYMVLDNVNQDGYPVSVRLALVDATIDHSTGYYEYRLYWQPDTGSSVLGYPIAFSVNEGGNNLPKPSNLNIDGADKSWVSSDFNTTVTGVTPNSTISFKIEDPNGDNIDSIDVWSLDSNGLTDELVSNYDFTGGVSNPSYGDGDFYEFETQNQEFLSKENTTYRFYVEMADRSDTGTERYSQVAVLDTGSGDASVYNSNITSLECLDGSNSSWKSCSAFNYSDSTGSMSGVRACVDNQNVDVQYVNFSIANEYDNRFEFRNQNYTSMAGGCYEYDFNQSTVWDGLIDDSGGWNVSVDLGEANGYTTSEARNWMVPWGSAQVTGFSVGNQMDSLDLRRYIEYEAVANYSCVGGECASEKSPSLNGSEQLNASFKSNVSVVGACSSTPFCTADLNPVIRNGSVQPGTSFKSSWLFNVTGSVGSTYNLFTELNSSNPNVANNSSSRVEVSIVSNNVAPSADFSFSPSNPTTGESISFNGSSSSDSDGSIQQYKWDWEDDGTYDDLGATVTHSYSGSGDYDVRLQVLDDDGATDTRVRTVSVSSSTSSGGGGGSSSPPDDNTTSTDDGSGDDGTSSGDTSESDSGEVVTIIKEVNNSEYSWTVGAAVSSGSQYFEPIGYPGRQITREIEVENTGDRPVPLELECVSSGSVCSWFELSTKSVNLSKGESQTIEVSGRIPGDISPDQLYEFQVRVTDPTYSGGNDGIASVDFSIAIDPGLGRLLVLVNKVTEPRDVAGASVPYGVLGLLAMVGFWIVATLVETAAGKQNYPIIKLGSAFLVFWIAVALL